MGIIAIDLGTTNIKAASYTDDAKPIQLFSEKVIYHSEQTKVTFDPEEYFGSICRLIQKCAAGSGAGCSCMQIILTGQAESLVLLGADDHPLMPGISWLDSRSLAQCDELEKQFPPEISYPITGQPKIIPTWPVTKLLWIRQNQPDLFRQIHHIFLLKDYIIYRLTGEAAGEYSIYPFSHYFDLVHKTYWSDILSYIGICESQLPRLVEPCSIVGPLLPSVSRTLSLPPETTVNAGTLDHFAGMIGTGNIRPGKINESAGTVSSIAAFSEKMPSAGSGIPFYCGPFKDSYIYLPVCESGGISLDWFKDEVLNGYSYQELESGIKTCDFTDLPIFLPYITGINPPDYHPGTSGVFYGLHTSHNRFHMAAAVMAGVACLLKKNILHFEMSHIPVNEIISTGGGTHSPLWCQLKADITEKPLIVPDDTQACCLGSAIIASVAKGAYKNFETATHSCVHIKSVYTPTNSPMYQEIYHRFSHVYDSLFKG